MTNQTYVSLFGSIGVGKTTAGHALEKLFPNIGFVEEGLSENPYLSRFYGDMNRWGFLSTLEMLVGMADQFGRSDKEIVVLDNGIRELICYASLEVELGILSPEQFSTYKKLYDLVLRLTPPIEQYIFFYCPLETQLQRIQARGRAFEQDVDLTFLTKLNRHYENYVNSLPQDKLIRINTDQKLDYGALGEQILRALLR